MGRDAGAGAMGGANGEQHTRLLRRARELDAIELALAGLQRGTSSVLVFEGNPGTGKTSLLRAARREAEICRHHTLTVGCRFVEREWRLGIASRILERTRSTSFVDFRETALRVVAATADEPTVLCIDDAEFADEDSLGALEDLIAYLDDVDAPLLIAIAATPRSTPAWDALVLQATAHSRGSLFSLAPFDLDTTTAFLRTEGLDTTKATAQELHEITAGNPLLVSASADALRAGRPVATLLADPPAAVRRRASAILRQLGGDAHTVAEVASIAHPAPLPVVAALSGLERSRFEAATDALVDAHLVRGRDLTFVSELLCSAVAQTLPGSRRQFLHTAVAHALSESGAAAEEIAAHLLRSTPTGRTWAVATLRAAASTATKSGRIDDALAFLRRALDEHPPPELRCQVVRQLALVEAAGGRDEAVRHAVTALRDRTDRAERAALFHELGRALLAAGRQHAATESYERGLAERAGREWDLLLGAGLVAAARLRTDLWLRAHRRVRELVDDTSGALTDGGRAALAEITTEMVLRNEHVHDVVAAARRALPEDARQFSDPALLNATGVLSYTSDVDAARAALDTAIESARDATPGALAGLRFRRAQCAFVAGDLAMARSDLETALAAEPSGWRQFLPGARALLALVLLETADPRDARAVLDQRVIEVDGPVHSMTTLFLDARARVRLALGEAVEARADFEAAGRLAVGVFGCHNPAVLAWRSGAAVAAHRQGQPAAARKLVADELRDARRFGEPRALARVLRVDGLLRRGDAGLHALEDALEIVEDSSARLEHAWVLADLGGALRRAGRVNDALVHLRHGADLASQLGATVLAERIRDELHLAGARPRRERSSGPLALTPGEARVAARAAAGATNREIAQELYISVKAVEFHLRNAYGKLSIRSRRELADALDGIDVAS